ncbi:MAG: hypothetical protein KAQ87_01720, partial [Candidatus Pacebacteria bacterium]|nr:hypothetical protein [Candidatus Paceibacterota bacterium]
MSNKIYFLMEIAGLVLLGYFAFSDDMVFIKKLFGLLGSFFLVGYPISMSEKEMYQKGKNEGRLLSATLKNLGPGSYFLSVSAVQRMSDSFIGIYRPYYVWLEHGEGMTPIEINESDGDRLEKIMGKPISQIREGEGFEINEN